MPDQLARKSRPLKIGMVCPYGWDTPGGVQIHIKELTEYLISQGHEVSVIAPVTDESAIVESWLVPAGRPLGVPFNGSVARVLFGPLATSRVKQWIAKNDFDLLHLHEPEIPSLSLLACWTAEGPMVATFHTSAPKQRSMVAVGAILEPVLEKLSARIAVSEMARETLRTHFDTDAVVIPNGIKIEKYRDAKGRSDWEGPNTVGFLGRFDEPRKGLQLLISAMEIVWRSKPNVRLLVAGPGDKDEALKDLSKSASSFSNQIEFLGRLSEEEKGDFLHSVTLYVAPNTGGESFGIILTEAMAAKATILASDIPAFNAVLNGGEFGELFECGNATDLARKILALISDQEHRSALASAGHAAAMKYDWGKVAEDIYDVYEFAVSSRIKVSLGSENRPWKRSR